MSENLIPFAERLREARDRKGVKQREVAEQIGITERAYQYYEGNRRRPDYEMLVALADYLEVTTDYLLGRTDTPD